MYTARAVYNNACVHDKTQHHLHHHLRQSNICMHPGMPAMVEKAYMMVRSSAGVGNLICLAETSVMAQTTLLMQRDALASDISAVSATVSGKLSVAR